MGFRLKIPSSAKKLDLIMGTSIRYKEEIPNIDYVIELSGADHEFQQEYIDIMKKEFSWQLGNYLYHIKQDEPRAAAEVVYKMKFIFTMLGMNRAFEFSELNENELQKGNFTFNDDFKKILKIVNEFLKTF